MRGRCDDGRLPLDRWRRTSPSSCPTAASRIVFAEDDAQIAKLRAQRDHLPDLLRVVTFDGEADGEWVLSLQDLQALGAKYLADNPTAVDEAVAAVQPEHLATLIYTSGTTGRPKGVELPHRCWTYIGAGAEAIDILSPDDLQYLWLPHVALVREDAGGGAAADRLPDGRRRPHGQDRGEPRGGPAHLHGGSPADLREGAREGRPDRPGRGRDQVPAVHLGLRRRQKGLPGPAPGPSAGPCCSRRSTRWPTGWCSRRSAPGSAAGSASSSRAARPCPRTSPRWFHAAGLLVLEGYALTETSAGACIVLPEDPTFGLVGPPLVGTEIKIADDGEIFVRGPGVMRGYHNLPEATAEVLDADGWFATGDVGEIDEAGRLRITDRKKDLIKTSGGKYIAPQAIEVMFKAVCPLASQMLVHARRPQLRDCADRPGSRRAGPVGPGAGPDGHRLPLAGRETLQSTGTCRPASRNSTADSTAGRPSRTSASSTTTCRSRKAS